MMNRPKNSVAQKSSAQILCKRRSSFGSNAEEKVKRSKLDTIKIMETPKETEFDYSKENTHCKGGLVHTLHGNIYQLKLQMLFLNRALELGYEFNLGTEVEDAEKFDDIVFKYKSKDEVGEDEIRFVQVKHKQLESKKITINDLMKTHDSKNNDFSIQKYFISYCKLNRKPQYCRTNSKSFILFTNIGFADLESITLCEIEETDKILHFTKSSKPAKLFKIIVPKEHLLFNQLKNTSDLRILVDALKELINSQKRLSIKQMLVLRRYHTVLNQKVFDVRVKKEKNKHGNLVSQKYVRFREDFINSKNLSEDVSNFRNVLHSTLTSKNNHLLWKELSRKEIVINNNYGKVLGLENNNNKLPNDMIEDTDIELFFEKLIFAVNQPNEGELGNIITAELGRSSQFNLLNADLVSDSFQRRMLDWFKEKRPKKGEEGVWLNAQSGKQFLNSIETEVTSLVSIGISVAYPEKLLSFGIAFVANPTFQELKDFLSPKTSSKKVLQVISSNDTILKAINVNSVLEVLKHEEEFAKYKRTDSYIFVRLNTLLGDKVQQYVLNAFASKHNYHLLVIDYRVNTNALSEIADLYVKLADILARSDKKIIIIAKQQNVLFDLFSKNSKSSVTDTTSFLDLTDASQEYLLKKHVTFQGQDVCLNKLIVKSDEKIKDIVDAEMIVKLIKGSKISLNDITHNLGEINDYYIDRRFRQLIIFCESDIKRYLEKKQSQPDLFVISGICSSFNHDNVHSYDDFRLAENKFSELCNNNNGCNIHWLKSDHKNFTWYKSYGSISNLVKYKKSKTVYPTDAISLKEDDFIGEQSCNKLVIISDVAGMGKSTVLTHLTTKLIKKNSSMWVTRINLNDHTSVFSRNKKIIASLNKTEILDFLSEDLKATKRGSKVDKLLFYNNFVKGNIVFLFDGFDEIYPDYKDIVVDLLKSLVKCKVSKIFITTRPNVKNELEKTLGIFCHELKPLTKDEQIEFLIKFWTKRLRLNDVSKQNIKRLTTYAESIVEYINKSINYKQQEFIRIPLQTMMVAEVFQDNKTAMLATWQSCKEFIEAENRKPELPDNYALLDLYEGFVRRKFEEFYLETKKAIDLTKKKAKKRIDHDYKIFRNKCALLAFPTLFSEEKVNELLSHREIRKLKRLIADFKIDDHDEGVIDRITERKPQFVHRSFAEYFASFLVTKKMLSDPVFILSSIEHVISNLSPIFINNMIKQLDGEHVTISARLGKPLMHFVLENHSNLVKCLLKLDFYDWPKRLDIDGKTPLHYAVEDGNIKIVGKLIEYVNDINEKCIMKHGTFKHPDYGHSKLVTLIDIQDNFGNPALYYALQKNHTDIAFELLLKGANIEFITKNYVDKLINKMLQFNESLPFNERVYNDSILGAYADQDNKFRPIQEKLLQRSPTVFSTLSEKDQSRILSYFFVHGRVKVIEALLGTINNLEKRKQLLEIPDNGFTPLHRIVGSTHLSDSERLDISKYLIENISSEANCNFVSIRHHTERKDCIIEILKSAAKNGSIRTFEYFITQDTPENYHEYMYEACQFNQHNIITYLLENYGNQLSTYGNTPLHSACDSSSKLKTIKCLIDSNIKVNSVNDCGETPLFMAIFKRRLKVIKYLFDKGADLNHQSFDGRTPLSLTIAQGDDDIIEFLIKNNARGYESFDEKHTEFINNKIEFFIDRNTYDLNLVDNGGYPRLHAAIKTNQHEWAQFLVHHGADVNMMDIESKSPLHWACIVKNTKMVELLLHYGAMYNIKDGNNKTPQNYLLPTSNSKESWLLNVLDTLFRSVNFMQNFDSIMLKKSKKDRCAHWGPYGGGYPDAHDSDNPMLFILYARNNQGKTLLHLAASDDSYAAVSSLLKFNKDYEKIFKSRRNNPDCYEFQPLSVNTVDYQGNSALHVAVQRNNSNAVQTLLDEGACFNSKNHEGKTPEMLALSSGSQKVIELFQPIKKIFTAVNENKVLEVMSCISNMKYPFRVRDYVNVKNESGKTLLHLAAASSQDIVANILLDNGADIDGVDLYKNTPLHDAAEHNEIKIVKLLLNYGAIYDKNNLQNKRPFDLIPIQSCYLLGLLGQIDAIFTGLLSDTPEIIFDNLGTLSSKYNLNLKNIINVRDSQGNTLLHYAAELCEYGIVEFLLKNGACYCIRNTDGLRPIDFTSDQHICHLLNVIDEMFENSLKIYHIQEINSTIIAHVRDDTGKRLLHHATESCLLKIVKYLVEINAPVDLIDIDYSFPEQMDKDMDKDTKLEIIKYLIDNGDVNVTNFKGESPLLLAVNARTIYDVIECLVSKGSNINQEDIFGNTPLSCAEKSDQKDIVKYFKAHIYAQTSSS